MSWLDRVRAARAHVDEVARPPVGSPRPDAVAGEPGALPRLVAARLADRDAADVRRRREAEEERTDALRDRVREARRAAVAAPRSAPPTFLGGGAGMDAAAPLPVEDGATPIYGPVRRVSFVDPLVAGPPIADPTDAGAPAPPGPQERSLPSGSTATREPVLLTAPGPGVDVQALDVETLNRALGDDAGAA